ncbi:hypothetical protein GO730_00230 [Spirosoma sp. HMF3257]|uniref:Uncharacterized protein n=1 Tax=Spirosoma telluris TaxID=2183553 RepID=A0A327NES6_9BACT|nr:hypothetical protein [Spirosoma telluris]RAI73233.1 hypothetical protein HMF3257_00225 [Spirosoma telluris]
MNDLNDLLNYFKFRELPETPFVISRWAKTCNLRHCVDLAMKNALTGNKTSIKTLMLIRDRLQSQSALCHTKSNEALT